MYCVGICARQQPLEPRAPSSNEHYKVVIECSLYLWVELIMAELTEAYHFHREFDMRVIVGGKFESALIHELDGINRPERNATTHPYYLGLNRKNDRSFFERLATFLAIAEQLIVPVADWSDGPKIPDGVSGESLGLKSQSGQHNEWDEKSKSFVKSLLENGVLSDDSYRYITELDLSGHDTEAKSNISAVFEDHKNYIAEHYLCRLILQIREAGDQNTLLVLDERDIGLITEIRNYIVNSGNHPDFAFPDLDGKVILGHEFAGGLLNFAPRDAKSAVAIRSDADIQEYAKNVRKHVQNCTTIEAERALVSAMRETYQSVKRRRKIEKVFEVVSWVVKPLHYVPGVDAGLTIAEDLKDVVMKAVDEDASFREWHLLAVRATQINLEDYLSRKQNL
jgi:hypothetical protein